LQKEKKSKRSLNITLRKIKRKPNIKPNKSNTSSMSYILSMLYRRIKDEKEREVQRLRELQEKAYDRQVNFHD